MTIDILPTKTNAMQRYKALLQHVSLFRDFSDQAIDSLLDHAEIKRYSADKLLFMAGDKARNFYILTQGWVKLFRETREGNEVVIAVLSAGHVFGESAMLAKGTYRYGAEIISDVELLVISSAFLREMAADHEHYDTLLSKFLEAGLLETNRLGLEVEHMAFMTSLERVGCFLLKMCGTQHEGSVTLQLPYEKALIAGRLGMAPETFSRCLSQLTAIGVDTHQSKVTIQNIAQLRARICEHCSATRNECLQADEVEAELL